MSNKLSAQMQRCNLSPTWWMQAEQYENTIANLIEALKYWMSPVDPSLFDAQVYSAKWSPAPTNQLIAEAEELLQ